jgi:UDP-2,3-diacylglucosamine hydrolase
MSHNLLKLQEGAIFISDAHYSFKHKELLGFFKALHQQHIQTPQLILMGDVFDLLFGGIAKTIERNQAVIELINTLSDNIEIIYLEGNHDFNLASVFPAVTLFPMQQQPVKCLYKGQDILLAHGDFNGPFSYRLYTWLIRSRAVLATLNLFNKITKQSILTALDRKLSRKDDCQKMHDFETHIRRHLSRVSLEKCILFIEGHHHQDSSFMIENCQYVNLPAFACGLGFMRFSNGMLQKEYFVESEVDCG